MKTFKQFCLENDSNTIEDAIKYHQSNNIPFTENIFRVGSENYFALFNRARTLHEQGSITLSDQDKILIETTDIGFFAEIDGNIVPLDCPMLEEHEPLNSPKRGGPKKFYVYVKDGDKIKKVTFGDTTGLSVKFNDPKARKSFSARHNCPAQTDKTSAAYWSCRLPHYAKQLGLSGGGNFFW